MSGGFAEFIQSVRPAPDAGKPLGHVLGRAALPDREDRAGALAAEAEDLDSRAAALLTRGYSAGQISQLHMRLAETEAELQGEREKLERSARRMASLHRQHEAGRISAFDVMRAAGGDDEGDTGRVEMLERRAGSLRSQIANISEQIAPPEALQPDPLEAASRRAHEAFTEVTRAKFEAAQAGRPAPRARRPFGSVSRGGLAVRSEQCVHCIDQGVDPETSFLLHSDPDLKVPVVTAEQAAAAPAERAEYRAIYR